MRSPDPTQGPEIGRFEKALAKISGKRFAAAVNSGTAALHAAYTAAGIGKGDEVLVPAITFAATANAVLYLGAKPVFVDVDPDTGTMSAADAAKKVTKKTRAIVPVDYAGRPCDYSAFRVLARTHKLVLIADAAQSLGALYKGKPAGSFADISVYSFHPVKSITTAEGGAIVTDKEEFAARMRLFRSHGISKTASEFERKSEGPWYQEMQLLGYNYRMPDLLASLGLSQLKRLKKFISKRASAARRYDRILREIEGIILPAKDSADYSSAWHLFPVRIEEEKKRKKVFEYLRKAGIGVQVHHIPVYLHPYYQKLGYRKGLCPVAESWYAREISLPLYPFISEKEQRYVARALRAAIA